MLQWHLFVHPLRVERFVAPNPITVAFPHLPYTVSGVQLSPSGEAFYVSEM